MEAIPAVDVAALAILALAVVRGLVIGLIREAFSLAGLAAACIAVRLGNGPAGEWLLGELPWELTPLAARIAAGVVIAAAVIVAVAIAGRLLRRSVHWAGLGFVDRLAGGALGAAEGALVIAVLMLLGVALLGRDDPALVGSRTLAAFEAAEQLVRPAERPEAAAPDPIRRAAAARSGGYGSTHLPRSRISSTRRSGASSSQTPRTTHSRPT